MMKRLSSILIAAPLVLLLTACSGGELSAEQIQARMAEFAGAIPAAETNDIALTPEGAAGDAAEGGSQTYSASVDLTWGKQAGRFSTEKALEQYTRSFAADISEHAPGVSMVSFSWTVPYHSDSEPAMVFIYEKDEEGKWLKQTDLMDRFTDETFGADAFTVVPRAESAQRTAELRRYPVTEEAVRSLKQPHHKTLILPVSYAPRHKRVQTPPTYAPRHKSALTPTVAESLSTANNTQQ